MYRLTSRPFSPFLLSTALPRSKLYFMHVFDCWQLVYGWLGN